MTGCETEHRNPANSKQIALCLQTCSKHRPLKTITYPSLGSTPCALAGATVHDGPAKTAPLPNTTAVRSHCDAHRAPKTCLCSAPIPVLVGNPLLS